MMATKVPVSDGVVLAAVFVAVAVSLAAGEKLPAPVPIPRPDLQSADDAVRDQVEAALEQLELLTQPEVSARSLAEAYAQLGRLGLLYELLEMASAAFTNAHSLEPDRDEWLYYLAVVSESQGDVEAAVVRLEELLERAPNDVAALIRLGRLEFERRQIEAARSAFSAALESSPESAAALDGRAQIAQLQGDLETAVKLYLEVLDQQPRASAVRYRLAMAYRDLGNLEQARRLLAESGSTPVTFPDPRMTEVEKLAVGPGVHMVRGNTAFVRRDYAAAAAHYQRAVAADPADLQARRALASALTRLGQLEQAMSMYKQILGEHPGDPVAHYNLGTIYAERGDVDVAITHLEAASQASPEYLDAHLNLALALEEAGRLAEAATHATRAAALDPQDLGVRLQLARLLYRTGRVDQASAEAREILTLDPENSGAHLVLGIQASERGDLSSAIPHLEAATGGDDDVAVQAAHRLGMLLGQAGRYPEAATAFGRAAALTPEDPELRFAQATALMLAQREQRALEVLEDAVREFPHSHSLKHALARLLATATADQVRDGHRALELAGQVFEAQPSIDHAETVAMALATLGRFEEAAGWQLRVIGRARAGAQTQRMPALEDRLRSYREREPVRSPWLESSRGARDPA